MSPLLDPANLAGPAPAQPLGDDGLIDLIATIPFQHADRNSTRHSGTRRRADFVMANPPFNIKEWWDGKLEGDARWKYGTPPQGNANFAWVQHMLHHLAPSPATFGDCVRLSHLSN